jgi:hypothetical protein
MVEVMTGVVEYEVLREIGPVQVRKYLPLTLATVTTTSDNAAFSILFDYISGNNSPNLRIEMTAPVISQKVRGEQIAMTAPVISDSETFSFVLPSKYNSENAPAPKDPRIRIVGFPTRYVAVIRFSGRANRAVIVETEQALLGILEQRHIKSKGLPFLMRYNSPFTPGFLRRNEVGIEILEKDTSED